MPFLSDILGLLDWAAKHAIGDSTRTY